MADEYTVLPTREFLHELEMLLRKHNLMLIGADYHDAILIVNDTNQHEDNAPTWGGEKRLACDENGWIFQQTYYAEYGWLPGGGIELKKVPA